MTLEQDLTELRRLTPGELRARYAEVFRAPTRSCNRIWLVRRIVWRLQALAEGDLSERARRRAEELANDADLRVVPPKKTSTNRSSRSTARRCDRRLPPPGTVLTRAYKGDALQVRVLQDGFEYDGVVFKSLSAVARRITGSHCNGFAFFQLGGRG